MGLGQFFMNLFGGGASGKSDSGRRGSGEGTTLACIDCRKSFLFESGEQRFYKMRGLTPPKRCPSCRTRKRRRR